MSKHYVLDGHQVKEEPDLITWAKWFESADSIRIVKKTDIDDGCRLIRVSTVFLGLDHSFSDDADPILFETMVFGGEHDQSCQHYGTWDEAAAGHDDWIKRLMDGGLPNNNRRKDHEIHSRKR